MSDNSVKNSALAAVRAAKEKQNAQKGGEAQASPSTLSERLTEAAERKAPEPEKMDLRDILEDEGVQNVLSRFATEYLDETALLIEDFKAGRIATKEPEREPAPAVEDILKKQS